MPAPAIETTPKIPPPETPLSPTRPTLLTAIWDHPLRRALREAAAEAHLELASVPTPGDVERWIGQRTPRAIVLPLAGDAAPWESLRASPRLAAAPLLGFSDEATELAFAETFHRGGDDLISQQTIGELAAKLRSLTEGKPPREAPVRRALVVSPSAAWRGATARRLRSAGFQVGFASKEDELEHAIPTCHPSLVVVDASLQSDAWERLLRRRRADGDMTPWLVSVHPRQLGSVGASLQELSSVAVHDAFSLDDAVVFVANELTGPQVRERRRSPRYLFGTRVWVRPVGGERDSIGFSYTVSEGGLFVRTLTPLPTSAPYWIEFTPPRSGRRVRLLATAVWSRPFGPLGQALSPAGVGFRIDDALGADWELLKQGCRSLGVSTNASA